MNDTPNHLARAREAVLERVRARVQGIDLGEAARRCGFGVGPEGVIEAVLLGRRLRVLPNPIVVQAEDGRPVSAVQETLLLRYLELECDYGPAGEEVPFRDLPGGAFYHVALARRTTELLERTFQNDLDRLRRALNAFPHELLDVGDVSARIHVLGRVCVTFVYRAGDDEFAPTADLLFDRAIASVYTQDEVAALATSLCAALIRGV